MLPRVVIIEKPQPFVSLAEAKARLRVDADDDDDLITGLIAAVCEHVDGPKTPLARAIAPQVLEMRLDGFSCQPICLRGGNILEVIEIGYVDGAGIAQVTPADAYELRGDELGTAWGKSWPAPRWQPEAVRIKYRAGYGKLQGDPPAWTADVPAPIKTAVIMHVGTLYANREAIGEAKAELPGGYYDLLSPFRIRSL